MILILYVPIMKMKKYLLIISVLILQTSFAQEPAFDTGEWFKFKMSYSKWLKAGNTTLVVQDAKINGKDVYHVVGKGWTTGMIKWFFKVEDRYESYFDKKTTIPYKFIRKIDEGGYTKDIEINFDQVNHKAYNHDKKHNVKSVFDISSNVQDMISAFYYLRNHINVNNLKVGDEFKVDMFFDEEIYGFKLKYLGQEIIQTDFGRINALKFRPSVMAGLTLWVSNDKNKIPLRVKADLRIGSLRADLEAFRGIKHQFKILVD
jgi:hypothetical protein